MKTIARLRDFGVPALKVRRFAGTIKGEQVERAVAILDLQSSPTCQVLSKLLKSAIANAQNNNQLDPQYLVVSNVMVDQGRTAKRIRPRARGRAYRILKRSCHVTIELDLKKGITLEQIVEERAAATKPKRARVARPKPAAPKAADVKAATEEQKVEAKPKAPRAKAKPKTKEDKE